jgi:hypothetical protein
LPGPLIKHSVQLEGTNNPLKQASRDAWNDGHVLTGTPGKFLTFDDGGYAAEADAVVPAFLQSGTGAVSRSMDSKLREIVSPFDFGAVGNGIADDTVPLQKFFDYCAANRVTMAKAGGNFAISAGILVGGAVTTATLFYIGDISLTALGPINQLMTMRGSINLCWLGNISLVGAGSTSFASRTCQVGLYQSGAGRMLVLGIINGYNLLYAAVTTVKGNTNTSLSHLGHIRASYCGSCIAVAGAYLTANWSAHVRSGSASVLGQRDTLTVDVLPPSWVDTYVDAGNGAMACEIGGELYQIMFIDRNASTIQLSHWMPSTATPGAIKYVFGGAVILPAGSDHNVYGIQRIDANACGVGLGISCLYGPVTERLVTQQCGVGLWLGGNPSTSMVGGSTKGYFEANNWDIIVTGNQVTSFYHYIEAEWALTLSKCRTIGARNADDSMSSTYSGFDRVSIMYQGRLLQFDKREKNGAAANSAVTVNLQQNKLPFVIGSNGGTTIRNSLDVDINRLYGFDTREVIFVGSGPNGGPTGSITFSTFGLLAGWTLNGGSVDVVFAGPFNGMARFVMRADYAAQNLQVLPLNRSVSKRGIRANGNADITLTAGADKETQRFATTLTADRTVTLSTTGAVEGDRFRISRSAAGAFNLNVGTGPLKALAAGTWCVVEYDGAAWQLVQSGAL